MHVYVRHSLWLTSMLAAPVFAGCGPDLVNDGTDEVGDGDGDPTGEGDGEGDGDGDGDATGDGDGDVLEECYELSQDSCPDDWPLLACEGTDPICGVLTYDSEQGLDATAAMTLECMLIGLRDGTPGVYRVEDTYVEGPRSLHIQLLADGNALVAIQSSSLGCSYQESVEEIRPTSFLQTCLDGELVPDTVETCLFGLGTGCAYYVGSPC